LAKEEQLEIPLRPIYDVKGLPPGERIQLERMAGTGARIKAAAYSDLLPSGVYGRCVLVLTDKEIFAASDGRCERRIPLKEIFSIHCRDFVGNGLLEAQTTDGHLIELIRYSKTLAESFEEIARRINDKLSLSEDELQKNEEKLSRVSGPKEQRGTYRCPNCGFPMKYASDICPRCIKKRAMLRRLMSFLKGHGGLVIAGALLSVVVTVANLGPGYLVRMLVDKSLNPVALEGQALPDLATREFRLYMIVGAFLGLVVVRLITQHFRIKVMGMLGARVVRDLRMKLYRALQRLSLSYYDREHTGRIMSRMLSDTQGIREFAVQGLQRALIYGLMVIAIPVILFATNPKLAVVALMPIPIVALITRIFSERFHSIYRMVRRRLATLSAAISDTISGVRVVKSFAQEEREIDEFGKKNLEHYDALSYAVRTRARFKPSVIFMMSLGTILVWVIGGREVLNNPRMTLGILLLFIAYMNQFYTPVEGLMELTEVFQQSATAAERVFSIMDMPSDVADHDKAIELQKVKGRIVFENVSFKYGDGDRVLKDINLVIEPGEMIGLVGQTGSGKSTLASLVCRFYDPTRGRITLDGIDLRDIKIRCLRGQLGLVLQDTFLFAGSIKENIAYGRPQASDIEIIKAAKAANAHDFIMNLPDGYDSEVGERGVMLSGGEKQRISIARAILKNPAILILDEATSSVDTATEVMIQEAMDRLVQGRTTIAIAHRLSTLRNADKLIVLDTGEIIEQGTHEELLEKGGTYAELCKIQASFSREKPLVNTLAPVEEATPEKDYDDESREDLFDKGG